MPENRDPTTSLRVAVTGHRDLDPAHDSAVRQAVREALTALIERCGPARVQLLTGMADGADQLVAEVALELGCALDVVLPKPQEVYERELSVGGAHRLEQVASMPGVNVSTIGATRVEVGTAESDPARPYHRLGSYLARSAHVLVALWDGQPERKSGGTLDVLSRFLDRDEGLEPRSYLPKSIESVEDTRNMVGPTAIWIETPREGAVGPKVTTARYVVASGLRGVWSKSNAMPVGMGLMLDDLAGLADISARASGSPPGYPLLDQIPTDIDAARRVALEEIHDAYSAADRLALFHQSRSDLSFIGASLIAAGMGFAFLWFAKIDDHLAWLYAYLALFLIGYGVFRTARARHWLQNHLSLRLLAETLRVRFFTTLLGVSEQVDARRVLALTGASSFPGFRWVAEADRIGVPTTMHQPQALGAQNELVRVEWVDDQAGYFDRRVGKLHLRHQRLEAIQRLLYVVSFLAIVGIIVFGADLKTVYAPGHVSAKTILIFLMGLLPLWLTLWELHQGRMATRELLWQYRNQATIFGRASGQLHLVDDEESRAEIYIHLAERSLFETYMWTIHRFHREFTPPSGG